MLHMFVGRKLVIATKHSKERVIAPVLEQALGVECVLAEGFDTDRLGTFSGEVERVDDPLTTARKKCLMSLEHASADLALASEGSFGPHPSLHFVPADDEIMMLLDTKNNLEIVVREISTETNFSASEVSSFRQLEEFARAAGFPSHALIMKRSRHDLSQVRKGIQTMDQLKEAFQYFESRYGGAYVETDMRAMYNPMRMKVIEKAAQKLAARAASLCPQCASPGFGVVSTRSGLPCDLCGFPTRSILSHIAKCQKCSHTEELRFPNNKTTEDPMYCDRCNP